MRVLPSRVVSVLGAFLSWIGEFLTHSDFPQLLSAMEIYIDRKVLPQMNTMNAMYKYAEQTIKENTDVPENDNIMA